MAWPKGKKRTVAEKPVEVVRKPISFIINKREGVLKTISVSDSQDNAIELQFEQGNLLSIQEV